MAVEAQHSIDRHKTMLSLDLEIKIQYYKSWYQQPLNNLKVQYNIQHRNLILVWLFYTITRKLVHHQSWEQVLHYCQAANSKHQIIRSFFRKLYSRSNIFRSFFCLWTHMCLINGNDTWVVGERKKRNWWKLHKEQTGVL